MKLKLLGPPCGDKSFTPVAFVRQKSDRYTVSAGGTFVKTLIVIIIIIMIMIMIMVMIIIILMMYI